MSANETETTSWRPWLIFAVVWAALLAVLFAPLFTGGVVVNPMSDGKDGYVVRHFAAEAIARWGEVPRWNPYIFGGMPLLGAMYGDQVYPITVALRALLAPPLAIGLGMLLHAWLGATGLLAFLRKQQLSWNAALVGATAYGIGGPLLSLFYPGHDGKMYVLGLTPWALLAIGEACRTRRPQWFALWGLAVALMLLSPHFQMTYYSSLLMGGFIAFTMLTETPKGSRIVTLAGFALASVLALAAAGAQLLPFLEYLPFSPRSVSGSTSSGWEYGTSWAMRALELIGTMWGGFNGWLQTYWGSNPFKLHSDYVGLLVGVLTISAIAMTPSGLQRKRVWFWVGVVIFGTLWVLGGQTPFYRIPYHLFPMISKTRAPSMMWGHVSLAFGVLSAIGVQQWMTLDAESRERWAKRVMLGVGGAAALFLLASGGLITSLADPARADAAYAAVPGARLGLLLGAVTAILFAVVAWRAPRWLALAACALLVADLGSQIRRFIVIDPRGAETFAADEVVKAIQADAAGLEQPWRVLPLGRAYMSNYFIEHRVRNVLGYHGNEIHDYDETLGGKNQWTQLANPASWRLLAVRYLLLTESVDQVPPGFELVGRDLLSWEGERVTVLKVPDPRPWAVVAPLAFKVADEEQVRSTVMNPQFDPARIALLDTAAAFGTTTPPTALPPAITPAPAIRVEEGAPGFYTLHISGLTTDGVLVISENYLPTWKATVDGVETPVGKANGSFISLPVKAGATRVELRVEASDGRGRQLSYAGLLGLIVFAGVGLLPRRQPKTD